MDIISFEKKADELLSNVEDLIHTMPQKGDTSEDCQRMHLQQQLNELQYAFNGTTQEDLED